MIKVYDKAQWHIDSGENPEKVVAKMKAVFAFLESKGFLEVEGKEIVELGIDSSVSLHERMVTDAGKQFMETCYDKVIDKSAEEILEALEQEYQILCGSNS